MDIRANFTYDYRTIKDMVRRTSFRNPLSKLLLVLMYLMGLRVIWVGIRSLWFWGFDGTMMFLLLLMVGILGGYTWLLVRMPKIHFKNLGVNAGGAGEYLFREEDVVIDFRSDHETAHIVLKYTGLVKILDTPDYLYLMITKAQTYVVDKATIEGGTAEDLRARLQPVLGKKYKIKKR